MAQTGGLRVEFAIDERMDKARTAQGTCKTDTARKAAITRLADIGLPYEIARKARRNFMT